MNKKSRKHIGLTNIVYKQPYELYLKTVKYNNVVKKQLEKKDKISDSNEPLNASIPMECSDKLYLAPQVGLNLFIFIVYIICIIFLYNSSFLKCLNMI